MINPRYATPTDNIIGSVMKSGEEGQYDWGQTQKSSDDSIRKLKAELYRLLNEKIPDEKAKIIQKAFRKRNNKTQKERKKESDLHHHLYHQIQNFQVLIHSFLIMKEI